MVYGVGISGSEKCKVNGVHIKSYEVWHDMLKRCYSAYVHKKRATYIGCTVCEEWLNYSNFKKWYDENIYYIEGQKMHLDKDILVKGNKIYSPETCVFVPQDINVLFTKTNAKRGNYPIGVYFKIESQKYVAQLQDNIKNKNLHLGYFYSPFKAFNAYKSAKEKYIKEMADKYKNQIPEKVHNAMYKYTVEITD